MAVHIVSKGATVPEGGAPAVLQLLKRLSSQVADAGQGAHVWLEEGVVELGEFVPFCTEASVIVHARTVGVGWVVLLRDRFFLRPVLILT